MHSFADPIPPGHGEPENVGASPGARCYSPLRPQIQKRTFRSASAARKFFHDLPGGAKANAPHQRPYHCSNCGGWHLSSS